MTFGLPMAVQDHANVQHTTCYLCKIDTRKASNASSLTLLGPEEVAFLLSLQQSIQAFRAKCGYSDRGIVLVTQR